MDITYILVIHLAEVRNIRIGKLGEFLFSKGYYLYVGSAKRNLMKRIERHLRKEKKRFWHIDYLLPYGVIKGVWTGEAEEEDVADILEKKLKIPVKGFGSSDSRRDRAHLFSGGVDEDFLKGIGFKRLK